MKRVIINPTISLIAISIITKLIGLYRDVVLADYYGASSLSDVYVVAVTIPTVLFYFIGQALSATFIPMYTRLQTEQGEASAQKYSDRMMALAFLGSLVFVLLLELLPRPIIRLFAGGFDQDQIELAAQIVCISAVTIVLMTAVSIISARLQISKNFVAPALISVPRNFFLILSIPLSLIVGLWWIGVGVVLAYLAELVFLLVCAGKQKIRLGLNFHFKDPSVAESVKKMLPIFVAVSVNQINKIIDRTIASFLAVGGISALYYAGLINTSLQEVLVTSVVVVLFTRLSVLVAEKKGSELNAAYQKTIGRLTFILLPAMTGMLLLSEQIVLLMFGRGNFDQQAVVLTAGALRGYGIGICFMAAKEVLIKVMYAHQKTKVAFILSVSGIVLNIVLNLFFAKLWGVVGLAVATSVSTMLQFVFLAVYYNKAIWPSSIAVYLNILKKPLIGCAVMGAAVFALNRYCLSHASYLLQLAVSVCLGIFIYALIEYLLKAEELYYFLSQIPYVRNKIKIGEGHKCTKKSEF